jgi:serine/threonine protein phosphatase 1
MVGEVALVGDVHGNIRALEKMLELIPNSASALVFLGDYVNRGPNSRAVLECLCDLQDRSQTAHFLRGNHETALLDCLESGRLHELLVVGGAPTIKSYVGTAQTKLLEQFRSSFPLRHLSFLQRLVDVYSADGLVASHDYESIKTLPEPVPKDTFTVLGHKVQTSGKPFVTERLALIDTGCGSVPNGGLCCFLWPSKRWCLVSELGTVKKTF